MLACEWQNITAKQSCNSIKCEFDEFKAVTK